MLVVAHENDGRPILTGERAYHGGDLRTKRPVEGREWLVEKQHPWGREKSPAQRHPLAFPSGEKPGTPVEQIGKKQRLGHALDLGLAGPGIGEIFSE